MPEPSSILPGWVVTDRLMLRELQDDDAPVQAAAVAASLDHLRPWMPWAAELPRSEVLLDHFRAARRARVDGGDASYGVFLGAVPVGGCGLHRRRGPGVLEIGYWVHVDHVRQGYATEMAAGLTTVAFGAAGIERVEIHHDRANVASRGVPERLGFRFAGESPDEVTAPGRRGSTGPGRCPARGGPGARPCGVTCDLPVGNGSPPGDEP
jgi:RimJ/RimL family protein N-acetyltransferase